MKPENTSLADDFLRDLVADMRFSYCKIRAGQDADGEESKYLSACRKQFHALWRERKAPRLNRYGFPKAVQELIAMDYPNTGNTLRY